MSNNNGLYDDDDGDHSFIENDSYDFNSRIMFCSIVFLTFIVLFVFVHHVYTKCTLSQVPPVPNQPTSLAAVVIGHREPPKSGLDPSVIASLPMFVISRSKIGKESDDHGLKKGVGDATECPICLTELEEEEMGRVLPNCGHVFHASCVDMWLLSNSSCPVCRTEAEPTSQLSQVPTGGATNATSVEVVCV
ncbi:unnamed protein product [Rhodiola kirilowii]